VIVNLFRQPVKEFRFLKLFTLEFEKKGSRNTDFKLYEQMEIERCESRLFVVQKMKVI